MKNHILVPHSFFVKARSEYRNWRSALMREFIQNSLDANSTLVQFFTKEEGGEFFLTCRDNGCGMTENVLRNVFLAMGGSTKNLEAVDGNIGGMGYAKAILCFAHNSYKIRTKHNIVHGKGGEYDIQVASDFLEGTEFTIAMEADYYNNDDRFRVLLTELVGASNFRSDFEIQFNGKTVTDIQAQELEYTMETDLGFLQFEDAPEASSSTLYVRVNKMAMFPFTSYTNGSSFKGILDLTGHPLELLTTNRDSLKGQYANKLNDLFSKLSNERTMLKCQNLIDFRFNPEYDVPGMFKLEQSEEYGDNQTQNTPNDGSSESYSASTSIATESQAHNPEETNTTPFVKLRRKAESTSQTVKERMERIDQNRYPANLDITTGNMSSGKEYTEVINTLRKVSTARIAHLWKAAVMSVMMSPYVQDRGGYVFSSGSQVYTANGFLTANDVTAYYHTTPVRVGLVFDKEVEGLNKTTELENIISLNPSALPEEWVFEDILDVAIHEISHLYVNYHDENFTRIEMNIRRSLRRVMKASSIEKTARGWIRRAFSD